MVNPQKAPREVGAGSCLQAEGGGAPGRSQFAEVVLPRPPAARALQGPGPCSVSPAHCGGLFAVPCPAHSSVYLYGRQRRSVNTPHTAPEPRRELIAAKGYRAAVVPDFIFLSPNKQKNLNISVEMCRSLHRHAVHLRRSTLPPTPKKCSDRWGNMLSKFSQEKGGKKKYV